LLPQAPTTILHLYQYLAEHFSLLGDSKRALAYADRAITVAPTHCELYLLKGKILKNAGDLEAASVNYEQARLFDGADRYLNTR